MFTLSSHRYFQEVARSGSLSRASETLLVAPSAISRQIKLLEDSLGTRLFSRQARGMRLTPAGMLLLEFLDEQDARLDNFRVRLDEHLETPRGRVHLATIKGLVANFLPQFIAEFREEHPGVKLKISTLGSNVVADHVAAQEADIGLLFGPPPRSDLIALALMRQPLCLVVSPKHRLASKRDFSISDLAGVRVILPDSSFGIRQELDRATASAKVTFDVVLEADSVELMRRVTEIGELATFLPFEAVSGEIEMGTLVAIPMVDKRLTKTTVTLVRSVSRPLTPAAQRAVNLMRKKMEEA